MLAVHRALTFQAWPILYHISIVSAGKGDGFKSGA